MSRHDGRTSCLCGQNAGTERCNHCRRLTCIHCHHSARHLDRCDETRRLETRQR